MVPRLTNVPVNHAAQAATHTASTAVASILHVDITGSTNKKYRGWQERFMDHCDERGYITGHIVNTQTMIDFIYGRVLVHSYQPAGSKKRGREGEKEKERELESKLGDGGNELVDGRGVTRPEHLGPAKKKKKSKKGSAEQADASGGETEQAPGDGAVMPVEEVVEELKEVMKDEDRKVLADLVTTNGPRTEDVQARVFASAIERLVNSPVASSTVNQCASALQKLYKMQEALGIAPKNEPPRGAGVASIIAGLEKIEARRKRFRCDDKGINSINDGFNSPEQLRDSFTAFLSKNTRVGLRGLVGHAIGFNALLRGDNQRLLCLSDLSSRLVPQEESPNSVCIIIALDRTKVDKDHKTNYVGIIRSKDVFSCGVFAIALYLFSRFHDESERYPMSNTSFPDLSRRTHWYNLPLLAQDRDTTLGIKSHTQNSAMGDMLQEAGVRTTKKTHVGRAGGAQLLEERGVDVAEIARAGRWSRTVMEVSYLRGLSWPAMKGLAGFEPHGSCFMARDQPVPETLARKIFPDVEKWLALLNSPEYQTHALRDTGGIFFLEMLQRLRIVLLQDIPHWRKQMPDFYLWKLPLFSDPEYLAWDERALRVTAEQTGNFDYRVRTAMPILCDRLMEDSRMHQEWYRRLFDQMEATQKTVADRDVRQARLEQLVMLLVQDGREQAQEQARYRSLLIPSLVAHLQALAGPTPFSNLSGGFPTDDTDLSNPIAHTQSPNTQSPLAPGRSSSSPQSARRLPDTAIPTFSPDPVSRLAASLAVPIAKPTPLPFPTSSPLGAANLSSAMPQPLAPASTLAFRMDRQIKTITELWREYAVGRGLFGPMKQIYETAGSMVCKRTVGEAELKFYQRRKVILELVELLGDTAFNGDYQRAAVELEAWRTQKKPEISLNALGDKVRSMLKQERLSILTSSHT